MVLPQVRLRCAAIAALTLTAAAIPEIVGMPLPLATPVAQALPVTYDITITVTGGSLKGNTFTGSFTYDDESLTYEAQEVLSPDDGISVMMNFLGKDYDASADTDYPEFPQLVFQDGVFQRLEFWVESSDRGSWWDTPGWDIQLTRSGAGLFQ